MLLIDIATTGVCPNDPEHHTFGVNLAPSTGITLNAEIAKAQDQANPLAKLTIAVSRICVRAFGHAADTMQDVKVPIPNACFGFGPVVAKGGNHASEIRLSQFRL
jgi:hypothetical protein